MCPDIWKNFGAKVLFIGGKTLILFGTLLYFFDIGSDIASTQRLFKNCHVNYGIASICTMIIASLFTLHYPAFFISNRIDGPSLKDHFGFLKKYVTLNWIEFWHGDDSLEENEKIYIHCIKCFETMLESLPQIGLTFYVIHHHGLDEPVFTNYPGDVQICSLMFSILSITINLATRHAWHKLKRKPTKMELLYETFWNLLPIGSFMTAYCLFMITSKYLLISYLVLGPGPFILLVIFRNSLTIYLKKQQRKEINLDERRKNTFLEASYGMASSGISYGSDSIETKITKIRKDRKRRNLIKKMDFTGRISMNQYICINVFVMYFLWVLHLVLQKHGYLEVEMRSFNICTDYVKDNTTLPFYYYDANSDHFTTFMIITTAFSTAVGFCINETLYPRKRVGFITFMIVPYLPNNPLKNLYELKDLQKVPSDDKLHNAIEQENATQVQTDYKDREINDCIEEMEDIITRVILFFKNSLDLLIQLSKVEHLHKTKDGIFKIDLSLHK